MARIIRVDREIILIADRATLALLAVQLDKQAAPLRERLIVAEVKADLLVDDLTVQIEQVRVGNGTGVACENLIALISALLRDAVFTKLREADVVCGHAVLGGSARRIAFKIVCEIGVARLARHAKLRRVPAVGRRRERVRVLLRDDRSVLSPAGEAVARLIACIYRRRQRDLVAAFVGARARYLADLRVAGGFDGEGLRILWEGDLQIIQPRRIICTAIARVHKDLHERACILRRHDGRRAGGCPVGGLRVGLLPELDAERLALQQKLCLVPDVVLEAVAQLGDAARFFAAGAGDAELAAIERRGIDCVDLIGICAAEGLDKHAAPAAEVIAILVEEVKLDLLVRASDGKQQLAAALRFQYVSVLRVAGGDDGTSCLFIHTGRRERRTGGIGVIAVVQIDASLLRQRDLQIIHPDCARACVCFYVRLVEDDLDLGIFIHRRHYRRCPREVPSGRFLLGFLPCLDGQCAAGKLELCLVPRVILPAL